ncbi:YjfB family protein [Paenibacillus humicola]|uniref:YjfB family protein n=1 Tax=Paenibacillus humicola TaxID=3110540 RepID=UPI00237ACADC|nr:YjfB family protein [Paenibacillus humicola]
MSLSAVSTGMAMAGVQQQAGIALLAKGLGGMKQQGAAMVQMLERSAQPHLGGRIDIRV